MKLKRNMPVKGATAFLPELGDEELTFSSEESGSEEDESDTQLTTNQDSGSEDSDSCPEEVSFNAGREANKVLRKRTLEQIKLQDELIRKKRAHTHLRNTLQKQEKLNRIKEKALPDELLEEIEPTPFVAKPLSSQPTRTIIHDESEHAEDSVSAERPKEYVYGKTKFQVKRLKEELLKPVELPPEVTGFKNQIMFRKQNRRETSTRSYFARLEKKKQGNK